MFPFSLLRRKKKEPEEKPRVAPRRARAYVSYSYVGPARPSPALNPWRDLDPWQRDAWESDEE